MNPPEAALALYDEQARIIRAAVAASMSVWGEINPTSFSDSWVRDQIGDQLFLTLARSQELAAVAADAYTDVILGAYEAELASPDGDVIPEAMAGVSSDGRSLDGLLVQSVVQASVASSGGATLAEAAVAGAAVLTRIVGTQVADSGRASMGLGIAARPKVGWVRLVEPKACSRCVILAGRFYRWSNGFDRHPLCKCRNIPSAEDTDDLRPDNDPMAHFRSLSETEQNRQFTVAGARAIRDGADIGSVVNSRRGAMGLSSPGRLTRADKDAMKNGRLERTDVAGRPVFLTTEGTTIRADFGRAEIERGNARMTVSDRGRRLRATTTPRLMPESIYEIAEDREDAVRLLKRFGYIK